MDDLKLFQSKRKVVKNRRAKEDKKNDPRSPQKTSFWKRWLIRIAIFGSISMVLLAIIGYYTFLWIISPYQKWAEEYHLDNINNLDHPAIIFDRNGEEIGRIFDENRSYVTLDQIAPCMLNALVAQEDKSFWTHGGYDIVGIVRAGVAAFKAGGEANQGASTITQQLARGAFDLERRTLARGGTRYERKAVEIFLAMRIEKRFSKEQIIEFYLNRIYFGKGYYGIRAASLGYFGKEPIDLTVREAASLAALIKNPENYNPIKNPKLNHKWRNDVIDRMQRSNYLTLEEAGRIKKMPLELNPKPIRRNTSYLNALVQKRVLELFDHSRADEIIKSAGIRIHTTIDKNLQLAAENSLSQQLLAIESRPDYQAPRFEQRDKSDNSKVNYINGLVYAIDNKTGATLAYVGGRDFDASNYDIIQLGRRPVGTAMLPFLYISAFDHGLSPITRLIDDAMDNRMVGIGGTEGILGEWGMEVDKGRYLDSVTTRQALAWSKISASARLGMMLGTKRFINTLKKLAITPPPRNAHSTELNPEYYPRVYLGTEASSMRELIEATTVFANEGTRPKAFYIITHVTDSNGKTLWENPLAKKNSQQRATSATTAYRIHSILRQSLQSGAAERIKAYLPDNFNGALQTGTNYNFASNCILAYNSSLSCGVWIGYLNGNQAIYPNAFSADTCGSIIGKLFQAAQGRFEDKPIPLPDSTQEVQICKTSGQMATDYCFESTTDSSQSGYTRNTYPEYFAKGDLTLTQCSVHGDGMPTLVDFIGLGLSNSRVLPVAPILPRGKALEGDDPYESRLELNPRHRDGAGLSRYNDGLDHSDIHGTSALKLEQSPFIEEGRLDLPLPGSMLIPILPLNP